MLYGGFEISDYMVEVDKGLAVGPRDPIPGHRILVDGRVGK